MEETIATTEAASSSSSSVTPMDLDEAHENSVIHKKDGSEDYAFFKDDSDSRHKKELSDKDLFKYVASSLFLSAMPSEKENKNGDTKEKEIVEREEEEENKDEEEESEEDSDANGRNAKPRKAKTRAQLKKERETMATKRTPARKRTSLELETITCPGCKGSIPAKSWPSHAGRPCPKYAEWTASQNGENPLVCIGCDRTFTSESKRKEHQKRSKRNKKSACRRYTETLKERVVAFSKSVADSKVTEEVVEAGGDTSSEGALESPKRVTVSVTTKATGPVESPNVSFLVTIAPSEEQQQQQQQRNSETEEMEDEEASKLLPEPIASLKAKQKGHRNKPERNGVGKNKKKEQKKEANKEEQAAKEKEDEKISANDEREEEEGEEKEEQKMEDSPRKSEAEDKKSTKNSTKKEKSENAISEKDALKSDEPASLNNNTNTDSSKDVTNKKSDNNNKKTSSSSIKKKVPKPSLTTSTSAHLLITPPQDVSSQPPQPSSPSLSKVGESSAKTVTSAKSTASPTKKGVAVVEKEDEYEKQSVDKNASKMDHLSISSTPAVELSAKDATVAPASVIKLTVPTRDTGAITLTTALPVAEKKTITSKIAPKGSVENEKDTSKSSSMASSSSSLSSPPSSSTSHHAERRVEKTVATQSRDAKDNYKNATHPSSGTKRSNSSISSSSTPSHKDSRSKSSDQSSSSSSSKGKNGDMKKLDSAREPSSKKAKKDSIGTSESNTSFSHGNTGKVDFHERDTRV